MSDQKPWQFESLVSDPEGITVRVHVSVPVGAFWEQAGTRRDAGQVGAEIAHEAANTALKQILKAKWEPPF